MIYTVTFSPSLDYILRLDTFKPGAINRSKTEKIICGGKGINVSIVLRNLGISSIALGFTAGFTGKEITRQMVEKFKCICNFIELPKGNSRINVKIEAANETALNGQGPQITEEAVALLFEKIDRLKKGDYLVLAGSIPDMLQSDIYEKMLKHLASRSIDCVVDAEGSLLLNVLAYHPFLIKPNHHELGGMFGKTLKTKEELIEHGRILQERGARNVLISRGKGGAILLTEDGQCLSCSAPKGKLVNSVGSGDSMVAGFLAGWLSSDNYETAFHTGIAAGSASAFSDELATKKEVALLLKDSFGKSTV